MLRPVTIALFRFMLSHVGELLKKLTNPRSRPLVGHGDVPPNMTEHDVASFLIKMDAKLDSLAPLKEAADSIEHCIQVQSDKYYHIFEKLNQQDKTVR